MNEARHAELRELLGAHSLGLLEPAELAELEPHLAGCPQCRAELAELTPLGPALDGLNLDQLAEPAQLPDTVGPWLRREVARERAEQQAGQQAGQQADQQVAPRSGAAAEQQSAQRPGRRAAGTEESPAAAVSRIRRPALVLAAAAVAVVLAGFVGYRLAPAPVEVAMEPVPVSNTGTESDVQASASLVAHTWGVEVKLEATGFDPGERYRVQVLDRAGGTVSAGEFVGTGEASMLCNLNSSVLRDDATGFRVLDDRGEAVLSSSF